MMLNRANHIQCSNGSGTSGSNSNASGGKPKIIFSVIAIVAAGIIGLQVLSSRNKGQQGTTTSAGNAADAVEITLWDQEESENTKVMDDWIARFTKENPNIRVIRQTYPNEDLRTKFTTAATAGQAAELVWGPNDIAGVFSTAKLIQPVESFVELSKFTPVAAEAATLKGQVMGVPTTYGNHLVLFFNKNLVNTAPATTAELIEEARKHTDAKNNQYGLVFFQNEPFWLVPFVGAFGGWPLNVQADGSAQPELNSEAMKNALAYIYRLKKVEKIIPNECDYDCAKGLFLEGKAAFTINGDWSVKEFQAKLGEKLGIAALPVLTETGKPMTPMVSGRYVMVNAQLPEKKKDAVKKFLAFLTSREIQIEVAERLGRIPATTEALTDSRVAGLAAIQPLIAAAANGRPMPAQTEMRAAWDAMRPVQQKIMSGDLTAEAGVNVMQQSALEKLASLKK
ncbi:MAG: extracellular solute-binding protein [Betaproteobacteria bacterium]|nr:extracellular solute-binding protein [Betaproteobacteria bacterium]